MENYKAGGEKGNSNLFATNRLFKKSPLFRKRKKKAPGVYDPKAKYRFDKGGALLTKKVTCKKCGWEWDAADGGNDITTCHKCGGKGLIHAKNGGLNKFVGGGPTDCGQGMVWSDELQDCVKEQAIHSVTINQYTPYINAWNEMHPEQREVEQKKAEYLRKAKGLNKTFGVNADNFPQNVLDNIYKTIDRERNNYVITQYAKDKGFNPNKHVNLVENIAEKGRFSYDMAQNSKYGSKLAPSLWARSLAGAQELGNFIVKQLPGEQGDVFKYKVPGLSKKERKEIADSETGALQTASILNLPGQIIANQVAKYVKPIYGGTGADSRDQEDTPGVLSGQYIPGVDDKAATLLNPLTYIGLVSGLSNIGNIANATNSVLTTGANLTTKASQALAPHLGATIAGVPGLTAGNALTAYGIANSGNNAVGNIIEGNYGQAGYDAAKGLLTTLPLTKLGNAELYPILNNWRSALSFGTSGIDATVNPNAFNDFNAVRKAPNDWLSPLSLPSSAPTVFSKVTDKINQLGKIKKRGGELNKYEEEGMVLDLSREEIEEYRKGGYVIEDISVPSLSHMGDGGSLNKFAGGGHTCRNNYVWSEMLQTCVPMQCKSGYEWSNDFDSCIRINYYPEITVTAKGRKKLFSPYKTSFETTDDKIKKTKKKGMVYRSTADELKKLEAVKQKEIEEEIKRKELARLQALEDAFNATNKSDNTNVVLPTAEPLKLSNSLTDPIDREEALNKETERILNSGQGMFGVKDLWDDKHNALSLRELIKQQLSADPQAFYKKMENASYQDFVNREQKEFDNMNWLDVGLNEVGNFVADPIHTGATWLGGSRTGVQQGKHVRDVTDPDYNNWQRMTGYNNNWLNSSFNIINPLASAADAAVSFSQGDVLGFGANTAGALLKTKILTQGLNATSRELSGVLNKEILGSKYLTGTNALRVGSAYKAGTEYLPNVYESGAKIASGEGTWEDAGSGIYNLVKTGAAALPFTKFNNAALYPKIANARNTFGFMDSSAGAAGGDIVDYSKALDKVNRVGDAAKPLAFSAALRFSKLKKEGGAIEKNMSKSEIKKLIAQGYVIEEI